MAKYHYGWRRSNPDHRDYMFSARPTAMQALPPIIDLDPNSALKSNNKGKGLGEPFDPCWDQSQLGSCGPHSLGENITYDVLIGDKEKMVYRPSILFSYYVTRLLMGTLKSDSGVDNRTMLKAAAKFGWCDENLFPYDIHKFTLKPSAAAYKQAKLRKIKEYMGVPQVPIQMKACLAGDPVNNIPGRPFIFGFSVYESFESAAVDKTGIVPLPKANEAVLGGHDVLFVGYNDNTQLFKFKNHYSPEWGDYGYGYMPYAYAINKDLSGDFWVIKTVDSI